MSIHIDFKRFTRNKTDNIPKDNRLGATAQFWKNSEDKLSNMTKTARKIKVLIKKLYDVWKSNEKKKERKKLTKNDCDKELELCREITKLMKEFDKLESGINDTQIQPFEDYFTDIHKWGSDTQTKDQGAQTVDV